MPGTIVHARYQATRIQAAIDYVASLDKVPSSPYRNADGTLTADAVEGKAIFNQLTCYNCHGGEQFTDSPLGAMHDVGTLKASSGQRLGGPLTGLDTPTLRGVWATAPYLHDGSAPTLLDVLTTANPTNAHGATSSLNSTQLSQLVAYLNQIDDAEPAALPAAGIGSYSNFVATFSLSGDASSALANPDGDSLPNLLEYAFGESNPTNASSLAPLVVNLLPAGTNAKAFYFSFLRKSGGYWQGGNYRMADLEYVPQASTDLVNWSLPLVESPNPPGLSQAPAGHEWVTFQTPALSNAPKGFGRVRVELK